MKHSGFMSIDLDFLKKELVGTMVPKPISGTLSGHAAGEPFDKHVLRFIKKLYPETTFRQYEFLNKLYSDNPNATSAEERGALITPGALARLLNRGENATKSWSPSNQFEEKQNDTADILVIEDDFFNIIDVKTFNAEKDGQPPNIISAYKLATMCANMLKTNVFDSHKITYVGITWKLDNGNLKCTDVSVKELFKAKPETLYINWSAAMQLQFHVDSLDQTYPSDVQQWCTDYLGTYVKQAKGRASTMITKFSDPFEKYLK